MVLPTISNFDWKIGDTYRRSPFSHWNWFPAVRNRNGSNILRGFVSLLKCGYFPCIGYDNENRKRIENHLVRSGEAMYKAFVLQIYISKANYSKTGSERKMSLIQKKMTDEIL